MNKKTIFIILILGIAVLAVLVVIGIYPRKPVTPPVEGPSVPTQTETGIPAVTPAEGVAETPAEIPAEGPKFSSCVMLDEEYCNKGEVEKFWGGVTIGFNIPGAMVYSPIDGTLQSIYFNLPEGKGYTYIHIESQEAGFSFENLELNPELAEEMKRGSARVSTVEFPPEKPGKAPEVRKLIEVKKGELIGKISDKFYVQGYNLGICIQPESVARQYFPYIER